MYKYCAAPKYRAGLEHTSVMNGLFWNVFSQLIEHNSNFLDIFKDIEINSC